MSGSNNKEERIAELLKQNKTWNQIMKEVHVGPQTIKKVKDSITPAPPSKRIQAFQMLNGGSTLYDVSFNLDISSEEAKRYQLEYLELKGEKELVSLLKDKDISNLISISREIKVRLKQNVLKIGGSILEDKKIILCAAAIAMARTIRANPKYMSLFSDPWALETIALLLLVPGPSGNENELFKLAKSNLAVSSAFLMKCILEGTINTLGSPKYGIERLSAEIGQLMTLFKYSPTAAQFFKDYPAVL